MAIVESYASTMSSLSPLLEGLPKKAADIYRKHGGELRVSFFVLSLVSFVLISSSMQRSVESSRSRLSVLDELEDSRMHIQTLYHSLDSSNFGNAGAARALDLERTARHVKYATKYNYAPPVEDYPTPEDCGAAPNYEAFFKLGYKDRSRENEDKELYYTLFKEKLGDAGARRNIKPRERETIVELGAYDGSQETNSKFYERCLGWKSLLIEGNPGSFAKVIKNRPNAHRMSFAPSCSRRYEEVNQTVQFYEYPLTNVGLVGSATTFKGRPTVDVPCGPLGPVLEDVFEGEGKRVTLFSLDVEGAEPLVVDTIDFDKVLIEVLMIESRNANCKAVCPTRDYVRAKLKGLGYQRYARVVNRSDVYIHPKSRYQMPAHVLPAME
jgi:hypothetical protein